jgi:Zn finger protein HypA/HybF involved in hydrogenase expression
LTAVRGLVLALRPHQSFVSGAEQGGFVSETYNGYCVKCKEKRDFTGEVSETNGRRMAKGICPVCGTKMNRILGKA